MTDASFERLADDVCVAAAGYIWESLPRILRMPSAEGYQTLEDYLKTAFIAYFELRDNQRNPNEHRDVV